MRFSSTWLRIMVLLIYGRAARGVGRDGASADNSTNYALTPDALNKMLGALKTFAPRTFPSECGGNLDAEIANLQKQPKVESVINRHGLSLREFVLTSKAAAQIRRRRKPEIAKNLAGSGAAPQAKLDALQKLADSLKNNSFTPESSNLFATGWLTWKPCSPHQIRVPAGLANGGRPWCA